MTETAVLSAECERDFPGLERRPIRTCLFVTECRLLADVAGVVNTVEIPRIYRPNGWSKKPLLTLVPGSVEQADLKNLGVYFRNLAVSGVVTPDRGLESWVREIAGAPAIDPAYVLGPGETATDPRDPNDDADRRADPTRATAETTSSRIPRRSHSIS